MFSSMGNYHTGHVVSLWVAFWLVFGCFLGLKIHGGDWLARWLPAGFENQGDWHSQLARGLGTHMGSIGKQVPLPLHHHYMTSAGASTSCQTHHLVSRFLPPLCHHCATSTGAGML